MLSKHRTEVAVAEILSSPKLSKERARLIERQRNLGNFKHNCEVLKKGEGEIITWRAPSDDANPHDFSPCNHCYGFFLKKELWRHEKTCQLKPENFQRQGRGVISKSQSLLPAPIECSQAIQDHIVSSMHDDNISKAAKNDPLIMAFAEELYNDHGSEQAVYIRAKVREVGRFLVCARELNKNLPEPKSISNLASCIDPEMFPFVIMTVRNLCGFDPDKNSFRNPSLAIKMGQTLKKCAGNLKSMALIEGLENLKTKSSAFIELCEMRWKVCINSAAHKTLEKKKWNRPHRIPLTEDLRLLTEYLKEERKKCLHALQTHPTVFSWHTLAKVCLTNVILFNRRRSGEASQMHLSNYQAAKQNAAPEDDIKKALTGLEMKLLENFTRVEMRGKRGRKVPVLLTSEMRDEIEALNRFRAEVGVSEKNPYVFARPYYSSCNHMAGHKHLREAVTESGAKEPDNISSTRLRKHIGTVCQILNLKEHELEQVCGYMGHNIAVHREFYRLPQDTYQLVKVSRLLLSMEEGSVSKYAGKTLEEIEVSNDFSDSEIDFEEDEACEDDSSNGSVRNQTTAEAGHEEPMSGEKTASSSSCHEEPVSGEITASSSPSSSKQKRKCGKTTRKMLFLTQEQTALIHQTFRCAIDSRKIPNKQSCEKAIKTYHILSKLSWKKVKATVRNEIEKRKRNIKKLRCE